MDAAELVRDVAGRRDAALTTQAELRETNSMTFEHSIGINATPDDFGVAPVWWTLHLQRALAIFLRGSSQANHYVISHRKTSSTTAFYIMRDLTLCETMC